jgi:hypothetical protein
MKSSGSGLKTEINGRGIFCAENSKYKNGLGNAYPVRGNSLRWSRNTLYPQKLALISPTSVGRSVGIVCLRTTVTEILVCLLGYKTIESVES